MLHGFWKLTWVETKVFLREPMGVLATLGVPVVIFVILGRTFGAGSFESSAVPDPPFNVPILAVLFVAVSAVISLVAIMSIYREGGILKRLRATPLSPVTILGAHVFVKLLFTLAALLLLLVAGRRFVPGAFDVNLPSFGAALLLSTGSILSVGFVIAAIVPAARFAQPITAGIFYAMVGISGLFFPLDLLAPPLRIVALVLPTTHAVSLMQSIWDGAGWSLVSTVALVVIALACTALSAKVFRWE
jgi:ABC-2 type transport system permease protein